MFIKQYRFPSGVPKAATAGKRYTFIDIETTGLKRDATILYLIGCGYYERENFCIIQWFNDDGVSEPAMLLALQDFLTKHPAPLFTFNGESFDIPYLNRHYELNGMDYRLNLTGSLDLYRMLRPFQALLHLPGGKQKDWEHFLDIDREDQYNGGQLIGIYKKYLMKKEPELLNLLLLHNMEDIRGMETLLPLTAYGALLDGQFTLERFTVFTDVSSAKTYPHLTAVCQLETPLPEVLRAGADFSDGSCSLADGLLADVGGDGVIGLSAVNIDGQKMLLTIPVFRGTLKYFYPDYKNYFYLPEEDRAIHKSVGCYVDSQFREKAKPSTCYIRKDGLFLPFFPEQKYKGIRTSQKSYADSLTLYKNDYKDKYSFVEMQPIFHESIVLKEKTGLHENPSLIEHTEIRPEDNPPLVNAYLCDYMKDIFIAEIKKTAP